MPAQLLEMSEMLTNLFIQFPTAEESRTYGSFLITENQTESIYYELAPNYSCYDSCNFYFLEDLNNLVYEYHIRELKVNRWQSCS